MEMKGLPAEEFFSDWQKKQAKSLRLNPQNLHESFIDVDGEPLLERLLELVHLARRQSLPILFNELRNPRQSIRTSASDARQEKAENIVFVVEARVPDSAIKKQPRPPSNCLSRRERWSGFGQLAVRRFVFHIFARI
jgi:hypothetical protein